MNPQIKSGQRGGNRNFGLVGAGKGDSDRTTDAAAFNENLGEVNFPRVHPSEDQSFKRVKAGRYVKTYGKPKEHEPSPWPL